jgi:hypothetical protein
MSIVRQRGLILLLLIFFLLNSVGGSRSAEVTWPEAVSALAGGKSKAEACVALLKRYGTGPQIANGQLSYTNAKSDSDAVIAGLSTTLATGNTATDLQFLQAKINSGLSQLGQFCDTVKALLPAESSGEKGGVADALSIAKEAIGPLLKAATDGVAALYNNYRNDKEQVRKGIQLQLESARWPAFAGVQKAE